MEQLIPLKQTRPSKYVNSAFFLISQGCQSFSIGQGGPGDPGFVKVFQGVRWSGGQVVRVVRVATLDGL